MRIAVLGAGAWGTALAIALSRDPDSSHQVILWARDPGTTLPSLLHNTSTSAFSAFSLPDSLRLTSTLAAAVEFAQLVLIAVPTVGLRETLRGIAPCGKKIPLIWGCKGFEAQSAKLPHQVAQEEYAGIAPGGRFVRAQLCAGSRARTSYRFNAGIL